jgi:hypothetical protein
MKKMVLAVTLLALAGTQVQRAEAGGGWGIAAGVTGGLVAGTVIGASIANSQPVYYSSAPAYYYPPPVAYAPAPAVVYATPRPVYAVAPVCYAPAPVIGIGFGFGRPYGYRGHYYRGRW